MDDNEYRAFLDLMMRLDPYPVPNGIEGEKLLLNFASNEAVKRGYSGWIEAYHKHNRTNL